MKLLPVRARRLTSLPIRRIPVRIRGGPNRGRRWSLAVSGRGMAAGTFEREKFEALDALVRPGEVVWDIGAHYGYATLIAARRAGPDGTVVAFEPSTANRWYLKQHMKWNGESAVQIKSCAVADSDRSDLFGGTGGSIAFHLGHPGETVEVRSFTSLVESGVTLPSLAKIDVEGAEALMLEGAKSALETARRRGTMPLLLLAVHTVALYEQCVSRLKAIGYQVFASQPIAAYLDGGPWTEDPDILAVPLSGRSDLPPIRDLPSFVSGREV